jgi:NAD(P)-dependent dehydrogenase (short-subunit alcohol dehydrogenase family)
MNHATAPDASNPERSLASEDTRASQPLAGMHAVVTGGGSGIGLAIARRLHEMGATLTLVGRKRAKLDEALATLDDSRHDARACDVGDPSAVAHTFKALLDARRAPHILVNNAGCATAAPFADISDDIWDETFRVNVTGVFHCMRAALPMLLQARAGRIVNIASTAGLIGYRNVAAYCAAKHAVIGLTRAVALEVARSGVTVNAVCPGYTDTDIVREAVANIVRESGGSETDARDALMRRNPQRRFVTPEEVAATVGWLCSPESQSINGQAISVSGGEVMTR